VALEENAENLKEQNIELKVDNLRLRRKIGKKNVKINKSMDQIWRRN